MGVVQLGNHGFILYMSGLDCFAVTHCPNMCFGVCLDLPF